MRRHLGGSAAPCGRWRGGQRRGRWPAAPRRPL